MNKKIICLILIALIGGSFLLYGLNKKTDLTSNSNANKTTNYINNDDNKKTANDSNNNIKESINNSNSDSNKEQSVAHSHGYAKKQGINSNNNSPTNSTDSNDTSIESNILSSISDGLDEACYKAENQSNDKNNELLKIFKANNGEKKYDDNVENVLGKNKYNLDLTKNDNLEKYIEDSLYVNSRDEAIKLYKSLNPEENRATVAVFNPINIVNTSLHSQKNSQFNYEDFSEYNGQYIRLEDCTYAYSYGNGTNRQDSVYSVQLMAYFPKGKTLEKDFNLKLNMDYSDITTLNYKLDKNQKITVEGKVDITAGGDTLTLKKCRIINN